MPIDIVNNVTQQTTPEKHLVRDVSSVLSTLEPDLYPLDTMLRRMKKGKPAEAVKIEWAKIQSLPRTDTVTQGTNQGVPQQTVAVAVAKPQMWRIHDIVITPHTASNPAMIVEDIVTDQQGVTRLVLRAIVERTSQNPNGYGTVPALAENTILAWIGNAKAEGAAASASRVAMPEYDYNMCEIFDTVVRITRTRKATRNYTSEHDWQRALRDQLKEFRRSAEYKAFFGKISESIDAQTGELRWTMNGVTRYISNLLTYNISSGITESLLIDWLVTVFSGNNGSPTRFLFADSLLAGAINKVGIANLRSKEIVQVLGVKVERMVFNFGEVFMKHHRGFNEMGLNHYGVLLDMEQISKRELRPMERIVLNLKEQGIDSEAEQYIEQSSIEVLNPPTHAIIKGV